jgi:protein-arginine kinase activator protein McsA
MDLLEREKKEAVRQEDYQRAARLRDRIEELKGRNESDPA